MYRTLFQIGPFTLYSYGLLVAVAFLLSTFLILRDSAKFGISRNCVFDCLIAVLIGGLIGGRLLFVLINWQQYSLYPLRAFMLREGGMAFHGALGMAVLAGIVVCRLKKISFWKMSDLVAPYIALGQAIGRIGCFLNGCCYGRVITGGVAVTYPGEAVMRMPVQVYSSLLLLLIFILLMILREKRPFDGAVLGGYIILYAIMRFFIEFYRGDNPAVFFGLTLSQLISTGMLACGVVAWMILRKSAKRVV